MKVIATLATALLASSFVMAADASSSLGNAAAAQYRYGMNLDVARVISISEPKESCGLVPVTMHYEDSRGDRHLLRFTQLNSGPRCPDN
ncbi:DUF2790 domain-containing protein [Pseudomonas sp. MM211]|uniref:DUF2790 domain-containing protein n=1 Tax=Pseudomonas sp. MM211 TaxID=2866808 RepID=UPI001CECCBCE|nr:DUF2790 domain-containing protein [Pseudomonas sp. MM211]UCJ16036.1 DUF2790 domain-containing protein [Pseudomonas sp. MM211]